MNLEEIEAVLNEALPLRVPRFDPTTRPKEKVEALETYLLASAHINGSLVEARHWLRAVEARLADEWASLQGWEVALRKRRERATAADVKAAKIQVAPQLYDAARKARALRESVVDQITRFEREERVVSRAYTFIAG